MIEIIIEKGTAAFNQLKTLRQEAKDMHEQMKTLHAATQAKKQEFWERVYDRYPAIRSKTVHVRLDDATGNAILTVRNKQAKVLDQEVIVDVND